MWWNMKSLSKNMDWREYEGKSNPLIPYFMAKILHTILKTFTASEESPAMPARGKPMNPAREANEGRARKPPKKEGAGSGAEALKTNADRTSGQV